LSKGVPFDISDSCADKPLIFLILPENGSNSNRKIPFFNQNRYFFGLQFFLKYDYKKVHFLNVFLIFM